MIVNLKKGTGKVTLDVPDHKIAGEILGKDVEPLSLDEVRKQIHQGVVSGAPRDISGKRVAVIVPDNTRLWARGDIFVPVIVDALLEMGVKNENICIIIALGTHADISPTGFPALVGSSHEKVSVINSANNRKKRLTRIGRTSRGTDFHVTSEAYEADHIIIFGGVLHHLIAGFGGGRKYILPGIAGFDSIQQNHALAFGGDGMAHPMVKQAQLEGNPVHEDMEEAALMFLENRTCTYVSVAAGGTGEIFYHRTGPLLETFKEGCLQVNEACCAKISRKGDFVLISAGGHRTDGQLYQATKALFNAAAAVRENGKILFVAGASEGVGNPEFGRMLKKYRNEPHLLGKALAENFSMPSYVAFRVMDLLKRFDVTLVSGFPEEETRELGFNYAEDLDCYISSLDGMGYVIPYAENILPELTS